VPYRKTPVAADELGISYYKLMNLLRSRRIPLPVKDSSGDFIWSDQDIENARKALVAGQRRGVVA
jgi:hypothetical protein